MEALPHNMLKTDETRLAREHNFVENRLKDHEILRLCNLRPLYLVVKCVDPKSGATGTKAGYPLCPESEDRCGADATER